MKLKNIIANMCLKGTENTDNIESMHMGNGCPQLFGFKTSCCGVCVDCYNKENETIYIEKDKDSIYVDFFINKCKNSRGKRV